MNVAKIHRKLWITESQFYFANISATEARIFTKFYVVVNFYLVSNTRAAVDQVKGGKALLVSGGGGCSGYPW